MLVAVTGATGFVGAALIQSLLIDGHQVRALARTSGKLEPRERLTIVAGDLENASALQALADGADAFIHLAGVTHPQHDTQYATVNIEGAARAAEIAREAGARFVHASSLSARLPAVSPYANSKFLSETVVAEASGANPHSTLRLPAIYGPGDHATLPYFKLVKSGFTLEPKTETPARATLLYVEDAARALITAALSDACTGRVLEVGDDSPGGREWREIGTVLSNIMNKKVKRLTVPRPVVSLFHNISMGTDRLFQRPPSVRTDQINEFFHPDWVAKSPSLADITAWQPEVPLAEGFAKTVRWYQDNALL